MSQNRMMASNNLIECLFLPEVLFGQLIVVRTCPVLLGFSEQEMGTWASNNYDNYIKRNTSWQGQKPVGTETITKL